ncbi:glucokinase [Paenibacillus baekrokdamisoli]|uniref:Glucokinase n=1 Tax=Paenibacillus baekrokdamisoli TaxID=1712516 RepID=A0A3G9JNI4_9BACL|nr:ROK family protein [Paenibacillus baekrokdamisoli]MBB3072866.1 glucokinase [Paenibacillus baekrokdamisoli]BBH24424.1 glucokinase [Paenibacillus baekrokdamisoli]
MIDLSHNDSDALYVGVDIGGTKVIVQIVDRNGRVVSRHKTTTSSDLNSIAEIVNECVSDSKVNKDKIAGYGFGVPAVTDIDKGIVIEAPALQWHSLNFVEQMQALLMKTVTVENDVNCAALGERWLGSAKSADDFVFIAIGTGVGAAIVTGGKLFYGNRFMAGEIGYLLSEEDWQENKRYTFKNFGALEEKISGRALSSHRIRPEMIFKQYKENNGEGFDIFTQYLKTLSITIANLSSLLNPQKIILGGGVSEALSEVIDHLRDQVAKMSPVPVIIECSTLGENAGAYGAAAFLINKLDAQ